MLLVAVLATPDPAEPFCRNAGLVKGSEALIAAVELSFPSAFETVIVVCVIFFEHSVLLQREIL